MAVYVRLLPQLLFHVKNMACNVQHASRIATKGKIFTETFSVSNEISPG